MKMIKKVFTLYDCKAEMYLQPFFSRTNGSAIREIQDGMKKEDSILSVHKNDLSLIALGTYDDSNGALVPFDAKVNMGTLVDLDPNLESNKEK
jgi:hypothetical protein